MSGKLTMMGWKPRKAGQTFFCLLNVFVLNKTKKDNPFLSAAAVGRAKFLVTNDSDLLDIPEPTKRKFKFRILTPKAFLKIYFERFAL